MQQGKDFLNFDNESVIHLSDHSRFSWEKKGNPAVRVVGKKPSQSGLQ
jgi:hypothetical protein